MWACFYVFYIDRFQLLLLLQLDVLVVAVAKKHVL